MKDKGYFQKLDRALSSLSSRIGFRALFRIEYWCFKLFTAVVLLCYSVYRVSGTEAADLWEFAVCVLCFHTSLEDECQPSWRSPRSRGSRSSRRNGAAAGNHKPDPQRWNHIKITNQNQRPGLGLISHMYSSWSVYPACKPPVRNPRMQCSLRLALNVPVWLFNFLYPTMISLGCFKLF